MAKSGHKFSMVISWLTMLYFIILFAERVQSMARQVGDDGEGLLITGYDSYVNVLTCVCLMFTLIFLAVLNRDFLRSLFDSSVVPDYGRLSITAGVLLAAGMVHTKFTIAPLQFAAYGMIIFAMVLRTVETAPEAKNKAKLWYSLIYLTMFSMSIPVMYQSFIEHAALFHILAAAAALILVACFTYMMRLVFIGEAEDLLFILPAALMAVLDAAVIGMRWNEEVNSFALIFAIVSAVMFIAGKLIFRKK